jgi:S-adenosylmethionine synthetase
LDECLRQDKFSRVACEVMITAGHVIVAGEVTCKGDVNYEAVTRKAIAEIGYDPNGFEVTALIHEQSADIAGGVDAALEARDGSGGKYDQLGAGDQGIVYGYATNENATGLPTAFAIAQDITEALEQCRLVGAIKGLKPDGKAMVTLECESGKPKRVHTVIVSAQHEEGVNRIELEDDIEFLIVRPICERYKCPVTNDTAILINPSGRFVIGGADADTGLTGRKLAVDTYGGLASHGGGAFSGKDATKVDRSGAYMARYVALNVVEAGLAERCEISVAYAIGKAQPIAVDVDTFGTGKHSDNVLRITIGNVFDFRPAAIIAKLKLREPIFAETAVYGAFNGNTRSWENPTEYKLLREVADAKADLLEGKH